MKSFSGGKLTKMGSGRRCLHFVHQRICIEIIKPKYAFMRMVSKVVTTFSVFPFFQDEDRLRRQSDIVRGNVLHDALDVAFNKFEHVGIIKIAICKHWYSLEKYEWGSTGWSQATNPGLVKKVESAFGMDKRPPATWCIKTIDRHQKVNLRIKSRKTYLGKLVVIG